MYNSPIMDENESYAHFMTDKSDLFFIERLFQIHHDTVHGTSTTELNIHLK